jgi:hypothetical protein
MPRSALESRLSWPADRFYWALLDAPGLKGGGILPPGLLGALSDEVPLPVAELHAVYVAAPDGKALVCAARAADLQAIEPSASSLAPAQLPPGLPLPIYPSSLNLLTGAFEPVRQRRQRGQRHMAAFLSVATTLTLVTIGLGRRAGHWGAFAADTREHMQQMASRAPLPSPRGEAAGPDLAQAVAMELANLKRVSESLERVKPAPDAALALAALLDAWPANVPSRPESLSISETGIVISVTIEGDHAPFLRAFSPPGGWSLAEPRLNSAGELTRLTLELRRDADRGHP